jgi:hypothetical protein
MNFGHAIPQNKIDEDDITDFFPMSNTKKKLFKMN